MLNWRRRDRALVGVAARSADDSALMVRLAASAVTLAVAVLLTLVR